MNETDVVSVFLELIFVGEADRLLGYKCDLSVNMSYSKNTDRGTNLGGGRVGGCLEDFLRKWRWAEACRMSKILLGILN